MVVNQLLVGGVDERHKEEGGGANDSKTPVGDKLDEIVGDECSHQSLLIGQSHAHIVTV